MQDYDIDLPPSLDVVMRPFIEHNKKLADLIINFPDVDDYSMYIYNHKFDINILLQILDNVINISVVDYFRMCDEFKFGMELLNLLLDHTIIKNVDDPILNNICKLSNIIFGDDVIEWLVINQFKINIYPYVLNRIKTDKLLNLLYAENQPDTLCTILDQTNNLAVVKKILDLINIDDYVQHCKSKSYYENYLLFLNILDKCKIDNFMQIQMINYKYDFLRDEIRPICEKINDIMQYIDDNIVLHIAANLFAQYIY